MSVVVSAVLRTSISAVGTLLPNPTSEKKIKML